MGGLGSFWLVDDEISRRAPLPFIYGNLLWYVRYEAKLMYIEFAAINHRALN